MNVALCLSYLDITAVFTSIVSERCFVDSPLKTKAVPLHTMEALGGRGGIALTYSRPWH
jgi:hypothetical protein